MRYHVLTVALLLGACATPQAIYNSKVDFSDHSDKTPAEVSQCLQLRWAESPLVTPDGKTNIAIRNGFQQVLGMVTIEPDGTGSRVSVRKTGQLMMGARDYRHCL